MIRQMRIAVIGQGYVGLTISVGALTAGHKVIGVDLSDSVIAGLRDGKSHIEGISDEQISQGVTSGNFEPVNSYHLVE
jgi:UDP-N-acetyl-D-glucosamine dehydrogenase